MRRRRRWVLVAGWCLAAGWLAPPAGADTVTLINGDTWEGRVVEETAASVRFDVVGVGEVEFRRNEIESLAYGPVSEPASRWSLPSGTPGDDDGYEESGFQLDLDVIDNEQVASQLEQAQQLIGFAAGLGGGTETPGLTAATSLGSLRERLAHLSTEERGQVMQLAAIAVLAAVLFAGLQAPFGAVFLMAAVAVIHTRPRYLLALRYEALVAVLTALLVVSSVLSVAMWGAPAGAGMALAWLLFAIFAVLLAKRLFAVGWLKAVGALLLKIIFKTTAGVAIAVVVSLVSAMLGAA